MGGRKAKGEGWLIFGTCHVVPTRQVSPGGRGDLKGAGDPGRRGLGAVKGEGQKGEMHVCGF